MSPGPDPDPYNSLELVHEIVYRREHGSVVGPHLVNIKTDTTDRYSELNQSYSRLRCGSLA